LQPLLLVVVEVENSKFRGNPYNSFKREPPNADELTLHDERDQNILSIEYLNRSAIVVTADLRIGIHHITITEAAITVDGRAIVAPGTRGHFCAIIGAGDADMIVDAPGAYFGTRDQGRLPALRYLSLNNRSGTQCGKHV
jgi:hypothetical protein